MIIDRSLFIVSENKVLCHPSSVDTISTSAGQEDHVSMGMTSATKLRSIVDIAEMSTAIELMTAAQALDFRKPLSPGRGVKQAYESIRAAVVPVTSDRAMSADIERIIELIKNGTFDSL